MNVRRLGIFILIGWLILSLSVPVAVAQDVEDRASVECPQSFDTPTSEKPPIDISNLPQPAYVELVNTNRTVAFTFPDGSVGMVATPVSAMCSGKYGDDETFQYAGTVWTLDGQSVTNTIVVAIDPSSNQAYLFNADLTKLETDNPGVTSTQVSTPALAAVKPQSDVGITAQGVCFILGDQNGGFVRYCLSHPLLSVQNLHSELYAETLSGPINDAASQLRDTFGMDFEVNADAGISEIEDSERIKGCMPGNADSVCAADIIGAPIVQSSLPQIGLLIVLQSVTEEGVTLDPGQYVIAVEAEQLPDFSSVVESTDGYKLSITGLTNDGTQITSQPIPSVVAPFISPDDYGTAEIVGMRFIFWCIRRECR